MTLDRTRSRLGGALALLGVLACAALLFDGGLIRHRALAGPIEIFRAIAASIRDGSLGADVLATLGRTTAGVALGAGVGVALGALRSSARRGVEAPLDFLRAIPPLLIVPLFCFALGYGEAARALAVAWAAALTVALHVGAARARPPGERERALRAMGASAWQVFRFVGARELVPPLVVGLRHAVLTGLLVSVATDMVIGADAGLGARAVAAQIAYDTPNLWAVLVVTGAIGWGAGAALGALERRVEHWRAA